jgi:hypothetical protein
MRGMSLFSKIVPMALLFGSCGHGSSRCRAVQQPSDGAPSELDESECLVESYCGHLLRAMNEKPLIDSSAEEVYRFVWLRSFRNPVSVRIESSHGRAVINGIELVERGKSSGKIARRMQRELGAHEWGALTAALSDADFWHLPIHDPDAEDGLDGATWILEGRRHGAYHVVERWEPAVPQFRRACELLLQTANFSNPEREMY